MPHQCTNCDRRFPDGSKEMLSGCPGCGGNKFQFLPSGAVDECAPSEPSGDGPAPDDPTGGLQFEHDPATDEDRATPESALGGTASRDGDPSDARAAGRSDARDAGGDESIIDADEREPEVPEDTAQADARSTVISDDELRAASEPAPDDEEELEAEDEPNLSALREELNEQFESIKILEPGQYELNLMELYDREEYIVALQEDGRYAIEVPNSWREGEE